MTELFELIRPYLPKPNPKPVTKIKIVKLKMNFQLVARLLSHLAFGPYCHSVVR